jgi:hypothetical protein
MEIELFLYNTRPLLRSTFKIFDFDGMGIVRSRMELLKDNSLRSESYKVIYEHIIEFEKYLNRIKEDILDYRNKKANNLA